MTAAVAVGAVLAGLAGVKVLEARLPRVVVRAGILLFVLGPLAGLGYAMWTLWHKSFAPVDLALLAVLSVVTGLGTSLGYHRLLTHRSFRTTPWLKAAFLAAGAMAVPSRPVDWAARHLEHHAHADREGDPHRPADGFLHAHVGWMLAVSPAKRERYCARLLDDPVVRLIDRTALVWLALGLALPALVDGWRGLLWGGIVRIALHNQTMFAVNSVCHAFGSQEFATGDESRNNRLVAVLAFGEGWHNNHHAFPSAAFHGLGRGPDATGLVIRCLERAGLAWDVRRPSEAAVTRRRARGRLRRGDTVGAGPSKEVGDGCRDATRDASGLEDGLRRSVLRRDHRPEHRDAGPGPGRRAYRGEHGSRLLGADDHPGDPRRP
ncbi:MAG TPA: acyl-CoA desaturase [Gaiellales bacterium]